MCGQRNAPPINGRDDRIKQQPERASRSGHLLFLGLIIPFENQGCAFLRSIMPPMATIIMACETGAFPQTVLARLPTLHSGEFVWAELTTSRRLLQPV